MTSVHEGMIGTINKSQEKFKKRCKISMKKTMLLLFIILIFSCAAKLKEEKLYYTWTPLIEACYWGDYDTVKKLLDEGEEVNIRCFDGPGRKLHGKRKNDPESDDWTPIMYAVATGRHKIIQLLYDHGAKLDVANRFDTSLLIIAVSNEDKWTVQFLLEKGVDVNHKNNHGYTAVYYSGIFKSREIYELLKNNKAEIDFKTSLIWNEFNITKKCIQENPELAHQKDADGWTPLMVASKNGNYDAVKFLIENKVNINEKNKFQGTALMHAALEGYYEIAKLLIENGANVNDKGHLDDYVIIWAVRSHKLNIVKLIVENGANIHIKGKDGKTPLMWAVMDYGTAKYLIEKGADVNEKDNNGRTALDWAKMCNNKFTQKLLFEHIKKNNFITIFI